MAHPNDMMTRAQWQATPQYQALRQRVFQVQAGWCADCGDARCTELHHLVYPYKYLIVNPYKISR